VKRKQNHANDEYQGTNAKRAGINYPHSGGDIRLAWIRLHHRLVLACVNDYWSRVRVAGKIRTLSVSLANDSAAGGSGGVLWFGWFRLY